MDPIAFARPAEALRALSDSVNLARHTLRSADATAPTDLTRQALRSYLAQRDAQALALESQTSRNDAQQNRFLRHFASNVVSEALREPLRKTSVMPFLKLHLHDKASEVAVHNCANMFGITDEEFEGVLEGAPAGAKERYGMQVFRAFIKQLAESTVDGAEDMEPFVNDELKPFVKLILSSKAQADVEAAMETFSNDALIDFMNKMRNEFIKVAIRIEREKEALNDSAPGDVFGSRAFRAETRAVRLGLGEREGAFAMGGRDLDATKAGAVNRAAYQLCVVTFCCLRQIFVNKTLSHFAEHGNNMYFLASTHEPFFHSVVRAAAHDIQSAAKHAASLASRAPADWSDENPQPLAIVGGSKRRAGALKFKIPGGSRPATTRPASKSRSGSRGHKRRRSTSRK